MAGAGKFAEFDVNNGNWTSYCDRLEMYFLANSTKDDLKLPILIANVGESAYELIVNLCSPDKPSTLTYNKVVKLVGEHLQPVPSSLAERYKFRQCRQGRGQSVADYVALLKQMSRFCDFGEKLEENLRDQLVCGLGSDAVRQRLFAEKGLDYNKAVLIASTMESAEKNASIIEPAAIEMHYGINSGPSRSCTACGDAKHGRFECKFKNYTCDVCSRVGHLRRVCPEAEGQRVRARPEASYGRDYWIGPSGQSGLGQDGRSRAGRGRGGGSAGRRRRRGARGGAAHARQYCIREQYDEPAEGPGWRSGGGEDARGDFVELVAPKPTSRPADDSDGEMPMYQMSLSDYRPVCMDIKVSNKLLKMEIDTGSPLSCISEKTYLEHFKDLPLRSCELLLSFYNGSRISPLGYLEVEVKYGKRAKNLDLYVINNGTTNLMGRQWLAELKIQVPPLGLYNIDKDVSDTEPYRNMTLNDIISRFKDVFDGSLGCFTGGRATLRLREGATPVFCRARPLPYSLRARVDAELDAMLAAGVVDPVDHSDWATPLVVAHKADGAIRLCADYKVTLNKVLLVDRYPVPKIDDLLSDLSGNRYFSKLDLSQAYNQILLDDTAKYTVINTHRGLFRYNRLVYGLASSPGIFQRIMLGIFKNVPNVTVFLDDILIASKTRQEHKQHIGEALQVLQSHGLKVKGAKCEFFLDQVKYLGFLIDKDGVRVDPEKIRPIVEMPPPTNVSELRSFLGMVNFYGKFIKNLSECLAPLYKRLQKGQHWVWGDEQARAFDRVKRALCSVEGLAHYDMRRACVVTVDASGHGVAAVLAQPAPAGERAVAYASRALTPAERHYSQIQKEALAIVFAIKKFHQYLYGRKFVLRTDHKPLVTIFGPNNGVPTAAASRLQRWAILLAAYDFTIEYVRTDQNTADALSRMIQGYRDSEANEPDDVPEQTYLHFASEAMLLDYNVLIKETARDVVLSRILSYIRDGWPSEVEIRELKPYWNRKSELYEELGCIMWGHRVVIPKACQNKVLRELHDSHMGIVKTKALARSYVWWPGLDEEVERAGRACAVCAAVADAPPRHEPRLWPWPERPWSRLHVDFLGPFAGLKYLVVVDSHSKWIEAIRMSGTTAGHVVNKLRELWARFGLPKQLVSDNGPPFTSTEFKSFLHSNGVEHVLTAPHHPASNGAAESAVKICKKVIKKCLEQNNDIDTALCRYLLNYRNTVHYATGESPAKLLQGRSLRSRLDCLKPARAERVRRHQARIQRQAGGVQRRFQVGQLIWYRKFGINNNKKWYPGRISECLGDTNYAVKDELSKEVLHKHVDQLRDRSDNRAGIDQHQGPPQGKQCLVYPLPVPVPSGPEESSAAGGAAGAAGARGPAAATGGPAGQATPELLVLNRPKRTRVPVVRYPLDID